MDTPVFGEPLLPKRPVWRSMARGWCGRCPSCGQTKLFSGFVMTVAQCSKCGEQIAHHRADDLPPYLNIFIVGHVVVGAMVTLMQFTSWNPWYHLALWGPATIMMSLLLMRPLKGAVIGLQWANRMHGFGNDPGCDEDPSATQIADHD